MLLVLGPHFEYRGTRPCVTWPLPTSPTCVLSLSPHSLHFLLGLHHFKLVFPLGDFELAVSPAGTLLSSLVIKSSDNKLVSLWSDFILKALIWTCIMPFLDDCFFVFPL